MVSLPELQPDVQVAFYFHLQNVNSSHLQEALGTTVQELDIAKLDEELLTYIGTDYLQKLASFGLRGEVLFPVPYVLTARPSLLGYYRLLYGFSQKEFYRGSGAATLKKLEEGNEIPESIQPYLSEVCTVLIRAGRGLVDGLDGFSQRIIRDLQLLTLGAQLRGGRNTRIGQAATKEVFALIESLVGSYIQIRTERQLHIKNEAGRKVSIEFSSDPDIAITEELSSGLRPLVSIEIKGGLDVSNIHNRIGEAEKSHQKAKARRFSEFWTILGVEVSLSAARQESPTTTQFFCLPKLRDSNSPEFTQFRDHLQSIIGIRGH